MRTSIGLIAFLVVAPTVSAQRLAVRAENTLKIARADETIAVPWSTVTSALRSAAVFRVLDENGGEIVSQIVDNDGDGKNDELIFQSSFWPGETKSFSIEAGTPSIKPNPRVF